MIWNKGKQCNWLSVGSQQTELASL